MTLDAFCCLIVTFSANYLFDVCPHLLEQILLLPIVGVRPLLKVCLHQVPPTIPISKSFTLRLCALKENHPHDSPLDPHRPARTCSRRRTPWSKIDSVFRARFTYNMVLSYSVSLKYRMSVSQMKVESVTHYRSRVKASSPFAVPTWSFARALQYKH